MPLFTETMHDKLFEFIDNTEIPFIIRMVPLAAYIVLLVIIGFSVIVIALFIPYSIAQKIPGYASVYQKMFT